MVTELQPWLEPLYTADQMRALDRWAIVQHGVPSLELMERAGAGVATAVMGLVPDGPVRIVCGKGNNGGDGLVAARKLKELDIPAESLLLWPPEELSQDARSNHERLLEAGGRAVVVDSSELPARLDGSAIAVDALLGTGFTGKPRPPLDVAIDALNGAGCPVVAVDVPSGADASSGEVEGACVRALLTVTFHAAKLGLWIHPAKQYAGRVEVLDIGIPEGAPSPESGPVAGLIGSSVLDLVPRRGPDSTKFSSGSVLVVGGSTGLTGAVCMTAEAAMRSGAGWVRVGVPRSLNIVFEQKLTEVMSVSLDDEDGYLVAGAEGDVMEAAERADAVALGPGLGRTQGTFELARSLAAQLAVPMLVDADGLNAFAAPGLDGLSNRSAPTVLTPHAGELARLLGTDSGEVSRRRLASATKAAATARAIVVLKGDDSLVVDAGGERIGVSAGGSPALATAGTGDVLSGIAAAFLAKGVEPFEAACAAVYAHARTGRLAAASHGVDSVIATDLIEALPGALHRGDGAPGRRWTAAERYEADHSSRTP